MVIIDFVQIYLKKIEKKPVISTITGFSSCLWAAKKIFSAVLHKTSNI